MTFEVRYRNSRSALLSDSTINHYNLDLFRKFLEWEEEKLKRRNGLPKVDEPSYKTLCGYLNMLRNVNQWFGNRPWDQLTESEIKKVYSDLEDGKITNRFGRRFEDRRSYYNKIFRAKPFQLAGLASKVETALEFFTDQKRNVVRFVSEEGFRQMTGFLQKPQHLALFWLSWDIGENIASLLELRVKHFRRQTNRDTKEPEYLVYLPESLLKRSRQSRSEPTIYPETVRYLDALFKYGREVEYRDSKGKIRRQPVPYTDDDLLFTFKYRQALQIFDSVVRRAGVKCEPGGAKPSWKDLRSGMACHLFGQGWHVEDINLRLGHSPQSKWLESYINYLAVNRKRVLKTHFDNNLEDIKNELEESKRREKLTSQRMLRQSEEISQIRVEIQGLKEGRGILSLMLRLSKKEREQLTEALSATAFDVVVPSARKEN